MVFAVNGKKLVVLMLLVFSLAIFGSGCGGGGGSSSTTPVSKVESVVGGRVAVNGAPVKSSTITLSYGTATVGTATTDAGGYYSIEIPSEKSNYVGLPLTISISGISLKSPSVVVAVKGKTIVKDLDVDSYGNILKDSSVCFSQLGPSVSIISIYQSNFISQNYTNGIGSIDGVTDSSSIQVNLDGKVIGNVSSSTLPYFTISNSSIGGRYYFKIYNVPVGKGKKVVFKDSSGKLIEKVVDVSAGLTSGVAALFNQVSSTLVLLKVPQKM
jgi:hypothetical protein